jgi:hypothetical protein
MRHVSLTDLPELRAEILAFLGPELLNGAPEVGLRLHEVRRTTARLHPLTTWWQRFQRDLEVSLQKNSFQISHDSARLAELYMALKFIRSVKNSERIFNAIRNRSTFYSTVFEAILAAMYLSHGYHLEIVDEGQREGEKSCDFIVNMGHGRVNVEAKSLEDLSIGENTRLEQACFAIQDLLLKNELCAHVRIEFFKPVSDPECARVVRTFNEFIQSGGGVGSCLVQGICRIEAAPIGQWGQWLPAPWVPEVKDKAMPQVYSFEVMVNMEGNVLHKNPCMISIGKYFQPRISNRIIRQIQRSALKFQSGEASLVHILLPYSEGRSLMDVVDASYNDVFRKLNKDHRRINTIILSAQLYDTNYRMFSDRFIAYDHYVVPNIRTKTELPEGFKLLLSDAKVEQQLGNQGKVTGWFSLGTPLEQQIGATLLWHCSEDGRSQLRIWQSHYGQLRAELVCLAHGRVVCESRVVRELGESWHLVVITWSDTEMIMYLDGDRIASTRMH